MEKQEIQKILDRQREYFETGATYPVSVRKEALRRLYAGIEEREEKLCAALKKDLGKSGSESYMCEIGLVKSEITYMLRHVGRFAREKRVPTPLAQYVSAALRSLLPMAAC